MNKLEIDGVSLSFGARQILSQVYLSCRTGEIVGLMGRNGSGKSSLLKLIFGNLAAESCSVRVNGCYYPQLFRVPGQVFFVPQDGWLMPYLTFQEVAKILRIEDQVEKILEIPEIHRHQKTKIGALSGGVKKLVEILLALYAKTSFVLLDEPFSYLAPALVEQLLPHLRFCAQHRGIILTDHHFKTVWSISDTCYLLSHASLHQVTDLSELQALGYLSG